MPEHLTASHWHQQAHVWAWRVPDVPSTVGITRLSFHAVGKSCRWTGKRSSFAVPHIAPWPIKSPPRTTLPLCKLTLPPVVIDQVKLKDSYNMHVACFTLVICVT